MQEEIFRNLRDWVEPAHPAIFEHYEDILAIYRYIQKNLQPEIDSRFDRIARQIGYVVASTVPVILEFSEEGTLKDVEIGADHLRGTLFEGVVEAIKPGKTPLKVHPGKFNLYLIWYIALKLRLRKDWVEPAHFRPGFEITRAQTAQQASEIKWDVREPAHWFDPGIRMVLEDAIQIAALDEVYPELHLGERVAFNRYMASQIVKPEVMEPAHFLRRPELEEIIQRLQSYRRGSV